MPALGYTPRLARRGVGGTQQMLATVVKANAADTVDFGADFTRVIAATIVGDSRNAPAITPVAGGAIVGTVLTVPAGYVNDDIDLLLIGPAQAT